MLVSLHESHLEERDEYIDYVPFLLFEDLIMPADDLALRFHELEAKVLALQAERARFPGWLAILVCGLLGGWLGRFVTELPYARAQGEAAPDLVGRTLKIVNEQGKTQLVLTSDKLGGIVRVFNAEGKTIATLDGDGDGGFCKINGPDGTERAFLGCGDKKGGGLLYFRNGDGKGTPVTIGAGQRGGYVTLHNRVGNKDTVWIGTHQEEDAGAIQLFDRQANLRCDLGVNKQGGMVNLYGNKKGKSHVFLGTGNLDIGGLLLLRDEEGKVRAEMAQGKNGGYLTLCGNKNDAPHIALSTSDDQRGGFLQVRANTGKVAVELGLDSSGQGYIDTFEKK